MDDARFEIEYKKVRDQLFSYLARATGDMDWAADILQEASLKAYRARKKFRWESSFKTWIYRIAMNSMKNQMVRRGRERSMKKDPGHAGPMALETPESIITGRQANQALTNALSMLEEGYRLPFLLKHVDGMSYREIADILNIGEGAARVRVHRARHALAGMLKEVWRSDHES